MKRRVIANTKLFLTREDGKKLALGEGETFEIYKIQGLGMGEMEKETAPNALQDGALWLGSRVLSRVLEIETEWTSARARAHFIDFFQHNTRFQAEILFNGQTYYGNCVLDEAYEMEDHGGDLYNTSSIEFGLYFGDPYLYTDTVYRYQIGKAMEYHTRFWTSQAEWEADMPEGDEYGYVFSVLLEAQEYHIENPSSTSNGIEAVIRAAGNVRNPRIDNKTTGQFIQIGYSGLPLNMSSGDEIYINTQMGNIAVQFNGKDALRYLSMDSRMIQVEGGKNVLLFSAVSGAAMGACEIKFRGKVLGV